MWNEIAAVQEVLYLLISEPLMNLDAKAGSYAGRQNYTTTLISGTIAAVLGTFDAVFDTSCTA
jgi:hypothetical protein